MILNSDHDPIDIIEQMITCPRCKCSGKYLVVLEDSLHCILCHQTSKKPCKIAILELLANEGELRPMDMTTKLPHSNRTISEALRELLADPRVGKRRRIEYPKDIWYRIIYEKKKKVNE